MSKEEKSELKCKLESMEVNPFAPEVEISVMPDLNMKIPRPAKDKHAILTQSEEVPAGSLDDVMM